MATKYKIPSLDTIQGGINAFDDLADTIANPPANRPLRQAIGESGRLYCDFVGSSPGQAILPWTGQGLVAPLLCKPYWDSQGYDAPVSGSPFTGGQCVGSTYNLSGQLVTVGVFCSDGSPAGGTTNLIVGVFPTLVGPVQSITIERFGITCRGLPKGTRVVIVDQGGARTRTTQLASEFGTVGYSSVTFSPVLGLISGSNNCGNPPGIPEPGPNPPPTPTFQPGEEPGFEPDGQPFFFVPPIDSPIGGEPIPVPPQPVDPGLPGDVAPLTPGDPGTPATTGSGGEASGTAPEGSELSGVGVEILTFPPNAARFQNNSRQPFRGAGYIAMGYPGLLGVDMSGGVINLAQFFHAQQRGLTSWRVTANIGFSLKCTPYYREVDPE